MPATIKDIARRAGVAHTTVSRALRGSPLISSETSNRIRQIALELGYHPSLAARSLKTRRSQAIGVILSNIADPFFSEVLQGIEDIAQGCGYSLFIAASQRDPLREKAIIRTMREHRVEGIILCSPPSSSERDKQLLATNIPIVVVNNQSEDETPYSIAHDDLFGSQQVTQHLISLGHRRIAYLGNASAGRTDQERLSGYRKQMQSAGLGIPQGFVYQALDGEPDSGFASLQHFLALPEPPSAIFCFNDMLAIGLLQALHQAGLRVPADCSVAGFDNISFSAYIHPPLTTFDQPKRTIGGQAARLLFDLLDLDPNDPEYPQSKIKALQGELLVRASTAAPNFYP